MLSLTRGRALFALALTLAAVMALAPVLTASADTGAAAAGKKKSCKNGKKGKAKSSAAKGCKKAKGKAKPKAKKPSAVAPKPGTRLTGTNTLVSVGLQYPGEIVIAGVTIHSIPATCSDGTTKTVVGSGIAPLKGMSFSGTKDFSSYSVTISGTFSSATQVSGTLSMTPLIYPNGVTCTVAPQQFTAGK